MKLKILGALFVASLALSTVNATASGYSTTAAASPAKAVSTLLDPYYKPSQQHSSCIAMSLKLAGCPITERLRQRLLHPRGYESPICRCDNPPRSVTITVANRNGQIAHVNARWIWGSANIHTLVYVTVRNNGGWLVDDTYCAGHPETSVYRKPSGPCP